MWGIFFVEFQCLPVDNCSAVSCDSGVLARGSESTSLYFAILNQSPEHVNIKIRFGDFPGCAVVKNPPANAGDTGSNHGPGRSHMPRSS